MSKPNEDLKPKERRREIAKLLARAVMRRVKKAKATGEPLAAGRGDEAGGMTDASRCE